MAKVRCNQCQAPCNEEDGFCPECGAVFTQPLVYLTDEEARVAVAKPKSMQKKDKEKKHWFSSFLDSFKEEEGSDDPLAAEEAEKEKSGEDADHVAPDMVGKRKIRCNECRAAVLETRHEGFCPECGAIFSPPYVYVTAEDEKLAKEAATNVEKKPLFNQTVQREEEKDFESMTLEEKQNYLKEKIHDLRDKSVNQRYWMNEKSNECMQCFTAAGSIKSNDYDEVLASMIKRRYENLDEFETVFVEYKRLLEEMNSTLKEINETKLKLVELTQSK